MSASNEQESHPGKDLFMSSLRRVLERHGYKGEELEQKIVQLMKKDVSRLASIISGYKK